MGLTMLQSSPFLRAFICRLLVAVAMIAGLANGTPAAAQSTSPKLIPINIGLPISNYWPAYIARELKLFEQVGLEPKFYMFQSGAPLIAGMKSGSLDVAWTGLATLFMLGQDIPLKFILVPLDSSSQMALVVNPATGINSFRDIAKAKNIGAPTATCAEVSMVLAAKAAGVPRASIQGFNLAPNLLLTALKSPNCASAIAWPSTKFLQSGKGGSVGALQPKIFQPSKLKIFQSLTALQALEGSAEVARQSMMAPQTSTAP